MTNTHDATPKQKATFSVGYILAVLGLTASIALIVVHVLLTPTGFLQW